MEPTYVQTIVRLALAEDIGAGDITTHHLIPATLKSKARLVSRNNGIICGINIARAVFKTLDPKVNFRSFVKDGQRVKRHDVIAEISGSGRALLSGERVAINFLTLLSGIATQTRLFVDKIKPYKTAIMDTRKTTPLLRRLERYAVRAGGGVNHRFNLNDMVLIKDNHRFSCRGRSMIGLIDHLKMKLKTTVEIEVDDLVQLKEALRSKADIILLDNMTPQRISRAVKLCRKSRSRALLEASGGITCQNVRQYAATGVDRISIGALTHTRYGLDISMEFIKSS